jgi:hypothetical protein
MTPLCCAGAAGGDGSSGGNQTIYAVNFSSNITLKLYGGRGGSGQVGGQGGNAGDPPELPYTDCDGSKSGQQMCARNWPWYQCWGGCNLYQFHGRHSASGGTWYLLLAIYHRCRHCFLAPAYLQVVLGVEAEMVAMAAQPEPMERAATQGSWS